MQADAIDPRAGRTRDALLQAFFVVVQTMRYEDIKVAHVVTRAGVSRSAFYAHFGGKDALLAASIAGPFSILANTLTTDNTVRLTALLEHFWENRALARTIFQDPIRRRVVVVLTDRVEAILVAGGAWKRGPLVMPTRLAAIQLAEMLLAPVIAWLGGESRCSAAVLAAALRRVGVATLEGMSLDVPSGSR